MKGLHLVAWILLIIGGLNWGLMFFGWGIGNVLPLGLSRVIYLLVGISALYELFTHRGNCKCCETGSSKPMGQM